MTIARAEATIADPAGAAWSASVWLEGGYNLSVRDAFTGTITLQRSFDGAAWHDVESFTAPAERIGEEPEGAYYRIGYAGSGGLTGTARVRLGQ